MTALADWLRTTGCHDVEPVTVKIGRGEYEGAAFKQTVVPVEGAVNRDKITNEGLYLLGELPSSYRRTSRVCFRFPGDERDWYVAGWADAKTVVRPQFSEFHPFGAWFQLRPWTVGAIDEHEPYTRMKASR